MQEIFNLDSRDDRDTALRLLEVLNMYDEHLKFKNSNVLADPTHYGHLFYFD